MSFNFSKISIYLFFFIGLLFLVLNNYNLDLLANFYLISCYILCSVSILIFLSNKKLIGLIPLFPLVSLYFITCYISLLFFESNILIGQIRTSVSAYNSYNYTNALEIFFIGVCSFFVGFILSLIFLKKINRKEIKILSFKIFEIFIFGISLMLIVIFLYYIIEIQKDFPSLSQIKYPLLLLGNGLVFKYFLLCENKKKNLFKIIFIFLLILIPICFELIKGSYAFPFIMIFLMYVFYIYVKKKFNIFPFILIALVFFFIHAGKYNYRVITWTQKNSPSEFHKNTSKIYLANVFIKTYAKLLNSENDTSKLIINNEQNLQRIFHSFESLLIVSKMTPKEIPYWDGYSYKILLTKFIPRVFWRNKPSDRLGNEFGHRYQILSIDTFNELTGKQTIFRDYNTSWNMPVLNEFYVNFGKMGVLFGMLMLGFLFGLITKIFSISNKLNVESTISFYIFVPLFFLESHLSLLLGAIVQSYIFLMLISFIFIFFYRKLITS